MPLPGGYPFPMSKIASLIKLETIGLLAHHKTIVVEMTRVITTRAMLIFMKVSSYSVRLCADDFGLGISIILSLPLLKKLRLTIKWV